MTAGEIYSVVAGRLLDVGVSDYTPDALREPYRQALSTLSERLAMNHIPAVRTTHYGRLRAGSTILNPAFHGVPGGAPYGLSLAALGGYYTLREQVPAVVEDEGVTIYFDQDVSFPQNQAFVAREFRVPSINGDWSIQLAEDRRSGLLQGALGPVLEDQVAGRAGVAMACASGWIPVSLDMRRPGHYCAEYEGDRYRIHTPPTSDMLFRLTLEGYDPAAYLDPWMSCPVGGAETFLINHTAALAVGDRLGDRMTWMADGDAAFTRLLAIHVGKKQKEANTPDYRVNSHIHALRHRSWMR